MQNLASSKTKLITALFSDVSGFKPNTIRRASPCRVGLIGSEWGYKALFSSLSSSHSMKSKIYGSLTRA